MTIIPPRRPGSPPQLDELTTNGGEVNVHGPVRHTPGARGWQRWAAPLATVSVAGLVVAGCGGGSPHPPSASASTQAGGLLAYSSCMRSHGVPNFPDPSGNGEISKRAVVSALQAVGSSQARTASDACESLLPGGSLSGQADPTITSQEQRDYLNAAACMRSHGITGFPDPTFPDGHFSLSIPSSIDTNSPQFTQAAQVCTRLIPAGLPDSRPGA